MRPITQALSAFVRRPSENWRFIRQAVHEIHFVLQGAAHLAAQIEERLARLEGEATPRSAPAPTAAERKTRRRPASVRTRSRRGGKRS